MPVFHTSSSPAPSNAPFAQNAAHTEGIRGAAFDIPTLNIPTPDIPLPIVTFSRWVYALTLGVAIVLQQPLITSVLLVFIVAGLLRGARWNLINRVARRLLAQRIAANAAVVLEDYRLIRFNNLIAAGLLAAAQLAFALNAAIVGWTFVALIIGASSSALAGFCVGCVLYYQFKLHRYQFFGE
jgi:hypothetical protein